MESILSNKINLKKIKEDHLNVKDGQVIEITGKKISEWTRILDKFRAVKKKASEVVALLQEEYDVPVDWARTITRHYLNHKENTL